MIQFLVNQALHSEHALDPNMTVLQYLREHLGKTGTKEGCKWRLWRLDRKSVAPAPWWSVN